MGSVAAHIFSGLSQRCSIGFKSRLWLGHSRTLRRVPKPLLHFLGCVLRVVVLMEGEPSPQSNILNALDAVFIKDLSVLCAVHLCLDPDWSLSPYCWKTSPQHDAANTMLHCTDGAKFPPEVTLGFQGKVFSLGFIRPENLVSHGL